MNAKLIAGIALAGLAIVFIIQNVAVVELSFLFWTLSMSMALAMFLVFSLGIIAGWLLRGNFSKRKSRTHNNQVTVSD
jgi:putative membrane protein